MFARNNLREKSIRCRLVGFPFLWRKVYPGFQILKESCSSAFMCRGAKGVIAIKFRKSMDDSIACFRVVGPDDEIMLSTFQVRIPLAYPPIKSLRMLEHLSVSSFSCLSLSMHSDCGAQ